MSKINITALHGFFGANPAGALLITGDDGTIILTKKEALSGWLTDSAKIVIDGAETTTGEENVRRIALLVTQWLKGEELDV